MRLILISFVAVCGAFAQPAAAWLDHLNRDLLPFWSHPDALGAKGDFPAIRCDDGTAVNWVRPCRTPMASLSI